MITKIILFALLLSLNIFYILNNLYFYQIKKFIGHIKFIE